MTLDQWRALPPLERLVYADERKRMALRCLRAARGNLAHAIAYRRVCRWRLRGMLILGEERGRAETTREIHLGTLAIHRALGVTWLDLLAGWVRRRVRRSWTARPR